MSLNIRDPMSLSCPHLPFKIKMLLLLRISNKKIHHCLIIYPYLPFRLTSQNLANITATFIEVIYHLNHLIQKSWQAHRPHRDTLG